MRATWTAMGLAMWVGCAGVDEPVPTEASDDTDVPARLTVSRDADGDGFGDPAVSQLVAEVPDGFVTNSLDCDDTDSGINPGVPERCNGVDDDCSGQVDDDAIDTRPYYADADGDGFGGERLGQACEPPEGALTTGGDCDDEDAATRPDAEEDVCSLVDRNCDGQVARAAATDGRRFASIAAAVDEAEFGGTVRICAGEYAETLVVLKDIELLGVPGDPSDVRWFARDRTRPLESHGENLTIRGITFDGNRERMGGEGGLVWTDAHALRVEDCVFEGGQSFDGGGLYWEGMSRGAAPARAEVRRTRFVDNAAWRGAGAFFDPGDDGILIVSSSTFSGNTAADGTAAFVKRPDGSTRIGLDVTWSGNTSRANPVAEGARGESTYSLVVDTFSGDLARVFIEDSTFEDEPHPGIRTWSVRLERVVMTDIAGIGVSADEIDALGLVVERTTGVAGVFGNTVQLVGGALEGNRIGVWGVSEAELDAVLLGAGVDANAAADVQAGSRPDDLVTYDGSGVTSVRCDEEGCTVP